MPEIKDNVPQIAIANHVDAIFKSLFSIFISFKIYSEAIPTADDTIIVSKISLLIIFGLKYQNYYYPYS